MFRASKKRTKSVTILFYWRPKKTEIFKALNSKRIASEDFITTITKSFLSVKLNTMPLVTVDIKEEG